MSRASAHGSRRRLERRHGRRRAGRRAAELTQPLPNLPLLFGALGGMAIAGTLALAGWLDTAPAGCQPVSACSLVQASRFASLLGVPTAAWGLAAYAALAVVALAVRDGRLHSRLALGLSAAGLAVSLYLTAVSVFELGTTCAWCVASLTAMTACFGVAVFQARHVESRGTFRRELGVVAASSIALVSALHLYYDRPVPAKTDASVLRALALHLQATGARFYGASWCRTCIDQKTRFGDAASLLPYVECAPEGRRGPRAAICRAENIQRYPTWIIGAHRHEGLLEVEGLAALSGFGESESGPARPSAAQKPAAEDHAE